MLNIQGVRQLVKNTNTGGSEESKNFILHQIEENNKAWKRGELQVGEYEECLTEEYPSQRAECCGDTENNEDNLTIKNEAALVEWIKTLQPDDHDIPLFLDYNQRENINNTQTQDGDHSENTIDDTVQPGYVYAVWNPFFGDLIKIGSTTKTPFERVRQLSQTNVPEPFVLVASIFTRNARKLEKEFHETFKEKRRYGKRNEFFVLNKNTASKFFDEKSREIHGFNNETTARRTRNNSRACEEQAQKRTYDQLLESKDETIDLLKKSMAMMEQSLRDKELLIQLLQTQQKVHIAPNV